MAAESVAHLDGNALAKLVNVAAQHFRLRFESRGDAGLLQKRLLLGQVDEQRLGNVVGQRRRVARGADFVCPAALKPRNQSEILVQQLSDVFGLRSSFLRIVIGQHRYVSRDIGTVLRDGVDFEAALSRNGDEETVAPNLVDLRDMRDGSDGMRNSWLPDFIAGLDEHDAEARVGVEAVLQQALVALFEYLERQRSARKQHRVQGKQGQCASFWQFWWHGVEYKRNRDMGQGRAEATGVLPDRARALFDMLTCALLP